MEGKNLQQLIIMRKRSDIGHRAFIEVHNLRVLVASETRSVQILQSSSF